MSGDRILSGDVMDTVHAGAQAMWDVRRLIAWLRQPGQDAPAVGVIGYSLGGYTAALLAGLESGVDCVISGNPAVDPSGLFWRNALSLTTRYLKTEGVTEEKMDTLMRPCSAARSNTADSLGKTGPSSAASPTGWCRRARPLACGVTGNSRASSGTRAPTAAFSAPSKVRSLSRRRSGRRTCCRQRARLVPAPRTSDIGSRGPSGSPGGRRPGRATLAPASCVRRLPPRHGGFLP